MSTKYCYRCKEEKPIESFSKDKTKKDGRSSDCKTCQVEYRLQWRKDNPEKFKKQRQKQMRQMRLNVKIRAMEYKGGKCEDCGIECSADNRRIFEFHHTDPSKKEYNIGRSFGKKWTNIKIELDKCVLLCRTCHMKRHTDYSNGLRETL